jgi:hypothetical protein
MAENPAVIREQMEQTRASLSEKIELLEQHVVETVHNATGAVTETMDTIKDAAEETLGTVRQGVQETVKSVRQTFDLPLQVRRHPWYMVGGAVLAGYVAGTALERRRGPAQRHHELRVSDHAHAAEVPGGAAAEVAPAHARTPYCARLREVLSPDVDAIKGLLIGVTMGVIRDLVTDSVHGELGEELHHLLDDMTGRLGGRTFKEPILTSREDGNVAPRRTPTRSGAKRY